MHQCTILNPTPQMRLATSRRRKQTPTVCCQDGINRLLPAMSEETFESMKSSCDFSFKKATEEATVVLPYVKPRKKKQLGRHHVTPTHRGSKANAKVKSISNANGNGNGNSDALDTSFFHATFTVFDKPSKTSTTLGEEHLRQNCSGDPAAQLSRTRQNTVYDCNMKFYWWR